LLFDPDLTDSEVNDAAFAGLGAAMAHAIAEGYDGLCFMYLPESDARLLQSIYGAAVVALDDQARLALDVTSLEDWMGLMTRKRRYRVRNEMRAFEDAGLSCAVESFAQQVDEVARLAAVTESRYGHATTPASIARVLRHQAQTVGDAARLFMARDSSGRAVACALYYEWRSVMHARIFGSDPEVMPGADEYFNTMFYAPVRYSTQHDVRALHLGTGSLSAKTLRGACLEPGFAAFLK
jgi:predicted N-acyltransferase